MVGCMVVGCSGLKLPYTRRFCHIQHTTYNFTLIVNVQLFKKIIYIHLERLERICTP